MDYCQKIIKAKRKGVKENPVINCMITFNFIKSQSFEGVPDCQNDKDG